MDNFDEEINFETELDTENPFSEEFKKSDVINSNIIPSDSYDETDVQIPVPKDLSDNDIDDIINYDAETEANNKFANGLVAKEHLTEIELQRILQDDDEDRKKRAFLFAFDSMTDDATEEAEILKKEFKDFLVLRNLTGRMKGIGSSCLVPQEKIIEENGSVEITDIVEKTEKHYKKSSVSVFKNEDNEISYIEVYCSCGAKTVVLLEYEPGKPGESIPVIMDEHMHRTETVSNKIDDIFDELQLSDEDNETEVSPLDDEPISFDDDLSAT